MTQEESVKIFDLVVKGGQLPASLDKAVPLSFIGAAAVMFHKKAAETLGRLAEQALLRGDESEWQRLMAQKKATVGDGTDAGVMLLNIESIIGRLSIETPRTPPRYEEGKRGTNKADAPLKAARLGLSGAKMKKAETIYRNPAAVAAVIKEAKENEDIPTKTAVLNKIRADKAEAANRAYREGKAEDKAAAQLVAAKGNAAKYLSKLREVVLVLPVTVPKDGWSDASYAEARGMVDIIKSRLEVWNED